MRSEIAEVRAEIAQLRLSRGRVSPPPFGEGYVSPRLRPGTTTSPFFNTPKKEAPRSPLSTKGEKAERPGSPRLVGGQMPSSADRHAIDQLEVMIRRTVVLVLGEFLSRADTTAPISATPTEIHASASKTAKKD